MGRPRKYFTEEDRLAAIKRDKKKYREKPDKKLKIKKKRKKRLSSEHGKTVTKLSRNTYERKIYSIKKNRDKKNENARIRRSKKTDEEKKESNKQRSKKRRPIDAENRQTLLKILGGGKCVQCGFGDIFALDVGHIHDTGHLDNLRFKDDRVRNNHYCRNPLEARENLQIQCSNCNQIQLFE